MQWLFTLSNQIDKPKYIQLYETIKKEIVSAQLKTHEKLPSIRVLEKTMKLSKTTIENAYNQLLVEGYIYSLPQKGYFVSEMDISFQEQSDWPTQDETNLLPQVNDEFQYDFKNEFLEADYFDFDMWKKHQNLVLNYEQTSLYKYGELQGELPLRNEIVKYVHRTRGITTDAMHIVLGAGVEPLLMNLAILLKRLSIGQLAIEDPGFNRAKIVFGQLAYEIMPIAVGDAGILLSELVASQARLCYVSPSHQFPTGSVLSVSDRLMLLSFMEQQDGYVIEDDFNSELRYVGQPIPAMKGLDREDRVIYLGSFSTVMVPAIRLSYMILPDRLIKLYDKEHPMPAQTASKIEQRTLASMMSSGDFERHVRRIRKKFAKKKEVLLELLKQKMPRSVKVIHNDAGLSLFLKLPNEVDIIKFRKLCEKEQLTFGIFQDYSIQYGFQERVLILRYRGISIQDMEIGIDQLCNLLKKNMI